MHHATKVLGFDGVEVGVLLEATEEALHVRTPGGQVVAISRSAVLDRRDGFVRLICYAGGVHRWVI